MSNDSHAKSAGTASSVWSTERQAKLQELERLQARLDELEAELGSAAPTWPGGYYTAYYATTGFMLGMIGAAVSLLFNVIGSLMLNKPQNPLHLIQVYLTFPL